MTTEYVVLLDEGGQPIGQARKADVHKPRTPLHLAFSCYGFDESNRMLRTRRVESKRMFPGVWTNTCCGHPMPGEAVEDALHRRLRDELGVTAANVVCALPDFRYRAEMNGLQENEVCPVFLCRITSEPEPRPDEVAEIRWTSWESYVDHALAPETALSPWSVLQVAALQESGAVDHFLAGG